MRVSATRWRGEVDRASKGDRELNASRASVQLSRRGTQSRSRFHACFAGAQRDVEFVCDWSKEAARGRHEVVRGCGARRRVAEAGRLLAHGVRGRYYCVAAYAGDWLRAVQAGDGRQVAG